MGYIKRINSKIAEILSNSLSAMPMFYVITTLVLVPLLYSHPTSLVAWSSYVCSVVFQGIALPILGYTSRKNGEKLDKAIFYILKSTGHIERLVMHVNRELEEDTPLDETTLAMFNMAINDTEFCDKVRKIAPRPLDELGLYTDKDKENLANKYIGYLLAI